MRQCRESTSENRDVSPSYRSSCWRCSKVSEAKDQVTIHRAPVTPARPGARTAGDRKDIQHPPERSLHTAWVLTNYGQGNVSKSSTSREALRPQPFQGNGLRFFYHKAPAGWLWAATDFSALKCPHREHSEIMVLSPPVS